MITLIIRPEVEAEIRRDNENPSSTECELTVGGIAYPVEIAYTA